MTDEMYDACMTFIDMLKSTSDKEVCKAMLDMLCDFDEWRWIGRRQNENRDWLEAYVGERSDD